MDKKHYYIKADYQLFVEKDGIQDIVEQTSQEQPMELYTGMGLTLPEFEEEILKFETGNNFAFTLTEDRAYGMHHPEHVVDVDKNIFMVDGKIDEEHIHPGAVIPLQNEEGNRFLGQIVEIGEEKVKVDLNHPLAGKALNFRGRIIEKHIATEDEINQFIEEQKHHHCGGGCGSCGDGGCGSCGDDGCGSCGDGGCGSCGDGGCGCH